MVEDNKIVATEYVGLNNLKKSNLVENSNGNRSINNNVSLCHPIGLNYHSGLKLGYYSYNNGEYLYHPTHNCSINPIYVGNYSSFTFSSNGNYVHAYVYEYDINNNYLGRVGLRDPQHGIYYPSSNVSYFHYCIGTDCFLSEYDLNAEIMITPGNILQPYEPYEGCLYGLELYDMIEPNFMTDNYYINCGIIFIFLALIILIINAPFIFIRKFKGN